MTLQFPTRAVEVCEFIGGTPKLFSMPLKRKVLINLSHVETVVASDNLRRTFVATMVSGRTHHLPRECGLKLWRLIHPVSGTEDADCSPKPKPRRAK